LICPDIAKYFRNPEKAIHLQHSVSDIKDIEIGKLKRMGKLENTGRHSL
jgi:hypothetical protein